MRLIDLTAPIVPSPPETPEALRTEISFQDHAAGAAAIEALFGVPPRLLRDGEGWAVEQPDYMVRGPGVTAEATRWLYDRGVRVMGIDAWGWDAPLNLQAEQARERDEPGVFWAAHQCDLPYCQIERLANLGALPPHGFEVACFPLKIVGGSAGPARVVAIVDR